jgi:hypothetical protein
MNALVGVSDSSFASGVSLASLPKSIISGAETITDLYVNNDAALLRLFMLTDQGNLYVNGDNTNAVSTGGIAGPTAVGISKIRI